MSCRSAVSNGRDESHSRTELSLERRETVTIIARAGNALAALTPCLFARYPRPRPAKARGECRYVSKLFLAVVRERQRPAFLPTRRRRERRTRLGRPADQVLQLVVAGFRVFSRDRGELPAELAGVLGSASHCARVPRDATCRRFGPMTSRDRK